jgi:hypothetical protein
MNHIHVSMQDFPALLQCQPYVLDEVRLEVDHGSITRCNFWLGWEYHWDTPVANGLME